MSATTFEQFRQEVTGWVRPGHAHGCPPVEVIPGLWTAHYDEIDSLEKLQGATSHAPITLVVNLALCQCESRNGFYGPEIRVLEVPIEDDPDERKKFDQGSAAWQSKCRDPSVPLDLRCAGSMMDYFDAVAKEIHQVLSSSGKQQHVLVHCKASLSRSVALILAYLMKYQSLSLLQAGQLLKSKWDATWPCDRFTYELVEYEQHLVTPHRLSTPRLLLTVVGSAAVGALLSMLLVKKK
jgi:protein-tyrosine phosphatase